MHHDLNIYFLVLNAEAHFLTYTERGEGEDPSDLFLNALNGDHLLAPNWEAVGVGVGVEFREDLNALWAYVSDDVLYDYKQKLKPEVIRVVREVFRPSMFEWNEMPDGQGPHFYSTFGRDGDGTWIEFDAPVERAIFASDHPKKGRELGRPAGPCKIIQNIRDADLPEHIKKELKDEVYQGEDLDNEDAAKIYDYRTFRYNHGLFDQVELSKHSKYRMDFRGVTEDDVQDAFGEFERWFQHRKRNMHDLSNADMQKLIDLRDGRTVKFEADKKGLTLIFKAVSRNKVRLVSVWWTGHDDPSPPRKKECSLSREMVRKAMGLVEVIGDS